MANQKIVMTGGGTAGHVTQTLPICPALPGSGFEIIYIGSYNGMEKNLSKHKNSLYRNFFRKTSPLF